MPRRSRPPARASKAEGDQCHAASGAHLRELLRGNHRYVFTLIHKFQTPEILCDRPDVIVLTDEAHRSQYDTLALNMRAALPKALFLAPDLNEDIYNLIKAAELDPEQEAKLERELSILTRRSGPAIMAAEERPR